MKTYINYDVNNLTTANKEKLRAFFKDCWRATYPQQLGTDITERMINTLDGDHLGNMLSAEDINALVCIDDKNIIGTCMYASRNDITYIWGVYVLQSMQTSGIGRTMLATIADKVLANNILQVVVLEASNNAVEFYKHLGFTITQKIVYELVKDCNQPAFIMTVRADSLTEKGYPLRK